LHDVSAGGEKIIDLLIDRCRNVHDPGFDVRVVIILRLLRDGEWARKRNFDLAVGVGSQELQISHLDRASATDWPNDPGDRVGMSGAV